MGAALTRVGGGFTLAPTSWNELMQFAELAAKSDMVPKDYRGKPANVALAVQWGGELGLSPMQALQNIAVINGRPAVWGDAQLALCQARPDYVDTVETYDEKTHTATCVAKRRDRSDKVSTFSAEDAKRAGLGSTHNTYPKRMRQMRARGFALRDQWADVLKGLISIEEARDYPVPDVRAEVVELPKVEKRTAAEALMSVPSTTQITAPVFGAKWSKNWAGKPVASAPADVVAEYMSYLEGVAADPERQRFRKDVLAHLAEIAPVFDKLLQDEHDKADPVATALQAQIDAKAAGEKNPAWGMDDIGDQPDDQPSHQEALGYEPGDAS